MREPTEPGPGGAGPREPLLWPREVAPLVGVTPKVVSQWARRGRLAYVRTIGGQRRYPAGDVVKLLRGLGHPDPERAVDEVLRARARPARRG